MKRIFTHVTSARYSSALVRLARDYGYSTTNWHCYHYLTNPAQVQSPRLIGIRHESTVSTSTKPNGSPDPENPDKEQSHGAYEMKDPESEDQVVNITVTNKEGKVTKIRGKIGDNLLYLAKRFGVEMEGACEASLACTTCHVYVEDGFYDKLEAPTEKEEDLLDMAPFLKENSRLGCQIILNKELEGLKVRLPAATKNFYVDGHKPSH